jgi:glutamine amidotransferase
MCIIASIPSQSIIEKSTLKRCWENNPHGGGFMYTDGKKVQVVKEMSSFKRYWKEFLRLREEFPQSTFVCHFRISTHGKINEDNCHPFLVNDKLGFVHNGIIRNAPISSDYSDTYMFNETILKNLPNNFQSNLAIMSLVREYIGSGSKLCFLSNDNKVTYVNKEAGQFDNNGVWFSNGGYKEFKYYDAGGTKVTHYNNSGWVTQNSKQSSMGFASAVIPNVSQNAKVGSKFKDINWDKKLKTDKLDNDVVVVAKSSYADRYDYQKSYEQKCGFCDKALKGYVENQNGFCFSCEDRYSREWSL